MAEARYAEISKAERDGAQEIRLGTLAETVELPVTGSANYDGVLAVGFTEREPGLTLPVGEPYPEEDFAVADVTLTADFNANTMTGRAENFEGATASAHLPQRTNEDGNIIQDYENPTFSQRTSYDGSLTYTGTIDRNADQRVIGSVNGRISSEVRDFNFDDARMNGEFFGDDAERLRLLSQDSIGGDDSETIQLSYHGKRR